MIGFAGDKNERSNGHAHRDLANLSDDDVDALWRRCCSQHIPPARIFHIALDIEEPDREEQNHLEWCDQCREIVARYRLPEETGNDDLHDVGSTKAHPERSSCVNGTTHHGNGQLRQKTLPLTFSAVEGSAASTVPALLREHLRAEGPVLFPNGEVAFETWQFGQLERLAITDPDTAEQIATEIVDGAYAALLPRLSRHKVVLVCFGRTLHSLGTRLGARLIEHGMTQLHIVLAHDYYSPTLVCSLNELQSADVTVFVDVTHTGQLLERLFCVCRECSPAHLRGLSIIGQGAGTFLSEESMSLWTEGIEERIALEVFQQRAGTEEHRQLMRFEPNNEYAIALREEPISLEARYSGIAPIDADSPVVEMIHRSGALRPDYVISGKRYPYVINVLDFLREPECLRTVVLMSSERLMDVGAGKTCLAYHAGRSARAGKVATILGKAMQWPVVPLGNRSPSFALSEKQCRTISAFENIVLVDAAIRTGDSLSALICAMDDMKARMHKNVIAFAVLDALSRVSQVELAARLGVDIRTLFTCPLAPPTERVRHWMNHQKAVIREALALSGQFENVEPLLRGYCEPIKRRVSLPSHTTLDDTRAALYRASWDAVAPKAGAENISNACRLGRVAILRHMPIDQVVHDPSVQNLLLGVMYNSMKPSFKETAVFALGAARNFEWMTYRWLQCNRPFLGSKGPFWKSVLMVACQMKLDQRNAELGQFRDALKQFAATLSSSMGVAPVIGDRQHRMMFDGDSGAAAIPSGCIARSASRSEYRLDERVRLLMDVAR